MGLGRVHRSVRGRGPVLRPDVANGAGLGRGQDGELDALLGEHVQGLVVDGGLGQPHPLRLATEPMLEVPDAPDGLGLLVAPVGERHDEMIVRLRDRGAVPRVVLEALAVGLLQRLVHIGRLVFEPAQERRPEIEADPGIVVHDLRDEPFAVDDPGRVVRPIAFHRDAVVPVVERRRGVLDLDLLQPGVLPGGLVEMAMDAYVSHRITSCVRSGGTGRRSAAE